MSISKYGYGPRKSQSTVLEGGDGGGEGCGVSYFVFNRPLWARYRNLVSAHFECAESLLRTQNGLRQLILSAQKALFASDIDHLLLRLM